jgi:D-cysteine desulfhydrase
MGIRYPKRIALGNLPTPIQKLERLSHELGVALYVKRDDLTGMELSGNKVRKLEFLIAEGLRKKADTIVTCGGVQSNHCRATAAVCARLGLKCHLILRTQAPAPPFDGNLLLDHLFGAEFTYLPQPEYKKSEDLDFPEVLDGLRAKGRKPFYFPVGGSVAMGSWGYARAFEETARQLEKLGIQKAHMVVATGSGGTHVGLVLGRRLLNKPEYRITGFLVCDTVDYFKKKNAEILRDTADRFNLSFNADDESFDLNEHYIGPGYALPYPELMDTIKMVGRKEGLVLDPVYTGKAFHGLLSEIKKGAFPKDLPIVFIHTGGIFGLFSQKEHFRF